MHEVTNLYQDQQFRARRRPYTLPMPAAPASNSPKMNPEKEDQSLNLSSRLTPVSIPSKIFASINFMYKIFIPTPTFLKFFIAALIPPIADQIIPLFFTGQIPNESALSISSQFIFISIILEVIQEGIVNSLFFYIGHNYVDHRDLALQGLKICIVIAFLAGLILTGIILVGATQFVSFIDTPASIIESTKRFLWISSFSFPLTLVSAIITNYLYITTSWLLISSQFCSVLISFMVNLALFGQQITWGLRWGVDELGYYKIIQAALTMMVNVVFLHIIEKMDPIHFVTCVPFLKDIKSNFRSLFNVSWANFGDSAVRNFFYFMVTLKFINYLGPTESGGWNLLNSLIWGLLLIPSYTTANYIKVQVGHISSDQANLRLNIKHIAKVSFRSLTLWLIILSAVASVSWPKLAGYFSQENAEIRQMSTTMFYQIGWIFIVFSFNNAMDSLFFGTGKTKYIFYQSLLTNLIVYFVPWILHLVNVLKPTLWWVLGLYIAGMLVDFCLTSYFCYCLWNQLPAEGRQSLDQDVSPRQTFTPSPSNDYQHFENDDDDRVPRIR